MNLIAITFTSFIIAFSGALTPGPLFALTIEHSLKKGFKAGPLLIVGHGILEILVILLIIAGFGDILKRREVFILLSIIGGTLLVWMGQGMIRKKVDMEVESKGMVKSSILGGIIASVSNPYWIIWWATIGMTYLVFAYPYGLKGIFLFFLGHILADFTWYSFVSFSISKGRKKISPSLYKGLLYGCGIFLIGFGIWLVGKGVLTNLRG